MSEASLKAHERTKDREIGMPGSSLFSICQDAKLTLDMVPDDDLEYRYYGFTGLMLNGLAISTNDHTSKAYKSRKKILVVEAQYMVTKILDVQGPAHVKRAVDEASMLAQAADESMRMDYSDLIGDPVIAFSPTPSIQSLPGIGSDYSDPFSEDANHILPPHQWNSDGEYLQTLTTSTPLKKDGPETQLKMKTSSRIPDFVIFVTSKNNDGRWTRFPCLFVENKRRIEGGIAQHLDIQVRSQVEHLFAEFPQCKVIDSLTLVGEKWEWKEWTGKSAVPFSTIQDPKGEIHNSPNVFVELGGGGGFDFHPEFKKMWIRLVEKQGMICHM